MILFTIISVVVTCFISIEYGERKGFKLGYKYGYEDGQGDYEYDDSNFQ